MALLPVAGLVAGLACSVVLALFAPWSSPLARRRGRGGRQGSDIVDCFHKGMPEFAVSHCL